MTQATGRLIDRYLSRIVVFCVVGICGCLAWLSFQSARVGGLASEGNLARQRQQATFPVSEKIYEEAAITPSRTHPGNVITQRDLACFHDSKRCPTPKPAPKRAR